MTLPTNIDASYPDRSAGDAVHQQHHDKVHAFYNKFDHTAAPAAGNTWVWDATAGVYKPGSGASLAVGGVSGVVRPDGFNAATATLLVDRIYWCGIIDLRDTETLDQFHVEVTGAGDGAAVIRFGTAMLTDAGVIVGETLTEHGSVVATTTGLKSLTGVAASRGPGRLALFALTNGATATQPSVYGIRPQLRGMALPNGFHATRMQTPVSSASYTGAMPASVPTMQTFTSTGPALGVEFL